MLWVPMRMTLPADPLSLFHPVTASWLRAVFEKPTTPQLLGWPAIARGDSTLILAPTGSGKTLTAFLWCIDKLMLQPAPADAHGCRVIYISPLKALAVDVERNLRSTAGGNQTNGGTSWRQSARTANQRTNGGYSAE